MRIFIAVLLMVSLNIGCGASAQEVDAASRRASPNASAPITEPGVNSYCFVFDGSGSMGGSRLVTAKEAVRKALQHVPPRVNLGLVVFDAYGLRVVLPLGSNNRDAFLAAIEAVVDGGGTPLGSAIRLGHDMLVPQVAAQNKKGEYHLVVITDGQADWTDGISTIAGFFPNGEDQQIWLDTIAFQLGQEHELRRISMQYFEAENSEELQGALKEITGESN